MGGPDRQWRLGYLRTLGISSGSQGAGQCEVGLEKVVETMQPSPSHNRGGIRASPLKNYLWASPVTPVVLNLLVSTNSLENLMKLMKTWTLLPRKVNICIDRPYFGYNVYFAWDGWRREDSGLSQWRWCLRNFFSQCAVQRLGVTIRSSLEVLRQKHPSTNLSLAGLALKLLHFWDFFWWPSG